MIAADAVQRGQWADTDWSRPGAKIVLMNLVRVWLEQLRACHAEFIDGSAVA